MGNKKQKTSKLGKLIPLPSDDQLLFLLSTGRMMNEVLAASCVPGLVEIRATCFRAVMCTPSEPVRLRSREPPVTARGGAVLSGVVSDGAQSLHITWWSRFNFINLKHELYEFLVHICSF